MEDGKMKEKMEEMKNKAKGLLKNFSNPFGSTRSSSSSTFQGQGYRLGGSAEQPSQGFLSSSGAHAANPSLPRTAAPPSNGGSGGGYIARNCGGPGFNQRKQQQQCDLRKLHKERWERERGVAPAAQPSSYHLRETVAPNSSSAHVLESGGTLASAAASVKSPSPDDSLKVERESRGTVQVGNLAPSYAISNHSGFGEGNPHNPPGHFDPYSPIIAAGTSHRPGIAPASTASRGAAEPQGQFQCPICHKWWHSEAQVSAHIDDCTGVEPSGIEGLSISHDGATRAADDRQWDRVGNGAEDDLDEAAAIFLSGGPSSATIEVTVRIFRKILDEPTDEKFRKLRLGNPKIKETIGSAIGGLKFLESVGFRLVVEENEKFSLMDEPSREQKERIQAAIAYLDSHVSAKTAPPGAYPASIQAATRKPQITMNRQLRIFYPSPNHLEEKFELPDSFYNLSVAEVKSEAAARRKRLEDSQMLIPKSFREKQAAVARQRYKATVVRVQLPDGLIIQGYFRPGEPTSSLYEFVSSTLKDGHDTFDLVLPAATKYPVIPQFPDANGRSLTMEEADLVPKALVKFNSTGPQGYTCLKSECYEVCEPLTSKTLLEPGD